MTIAVLTEVSDHGTFTYSGPATQLVARYGSLVMWPRSEKPIKVPFAWIYSLHFEELKEPLQLATSIGESTEITFKASRVLLKAEGWLGLTTQSEENWSPPVQFRFEKHDYDEGWDLVMRRVEERAVNQMSPDDYELQERLSYRGKKGCQDARCSHGVSETCYGWHCANCGKPSSYQGHYTRLLNGELGFSCAAGSEAGSEAGTP